MASDLFGRGIGGSFEEFFRLLSAPTRTIEDRKESRDEKYENLRRQVEAIAATMKDNLKEEVARNKGWVDKLVDFVNNFTKGGTTKGEFKKSSAAKSADTNYLSKIAKATQNLWVASQKQNTLWVGICHINSTAQKQIADAIRMSDCCSAAARSAGTAASAAANKAAQSTVTAIAGSGNVPASGGAGGGGTGGTGATAAAAGGGKGGFNLSGSVRAAGALFAIVGMINNKLMAAMDLDPMKHVFAGAVTDANNFRENMRQILHQQIGFTANNREVEQTYLNVSAQALASGSRISEVMKFWQQNLQRGLIMEGVGNRARERAAQRMRSVTTTALHTANTLGMSADATNEMFMDWHQHLALSANDIAEMGRHMQGVARNTGVTGAQLEKAMAAASAVTKSLQGAALASVNALKNITQITAIAQKHGVTETSNRLLTAMSSSSNFFGADTATQGLLSRAAQRQGLTDQLTAGTITQSPELTRQIFAGVRDDMRDLVVQSAGQGFQSIGVDARTMDMSSFNEQYQRLAQAANQGNRAALDSIRSLDNLARQRGMQVGDIQGMSRTADENSMTPAQRMARQRAELQQMQASGRGNLDPARQLERQIAESSTTNNLSAMRDINEAMRRAGVTNPNQLGGQDRAALQTRLTETLGDGAQAFLANMRGGANEIVAGLGSRAQTANEDFDKLLREAGYANRQALEAALSQGGETGEVALEAVNQITQRIQTRERRGQDPITDIRGLLTDTNALLTQIVNSSLARLTNGIAQIVFWVGQAVSILGGIWGAVAVFDSIAGIFGGSAGGAASGIAGALAPALGPLMLIAGAIKGFVESEAAGRGRVEGAILGALTGGAGTGSMFSSTLGIEQGSTADQALGVGGAAAWGAAAGAAIGAAFFGVGAPIGAAIGAVVGAAFELFKIFTAGTTFVNDWIIDPIMSVVDFIAPAFTWLWNIIKMLGETVYNIIAIALWPTIRTFQLLGRALGWLGGLLAPVWEGIKTVGEWVGWFVGVVWRPFGATIEFVGGIVTTIVTAIRDAFQWLYDVLYGHSIIPDLIEGIISFFAMLPIRIMGALLGLGARIATGIFNFLYDGLTSAFTSFIDWLTGLIPQWIRNIGSGFSETNAQADARIAESGNSVGHGIGRVGGGIWDMISGGEEGWLSLSGRWEGLKRVFFGAWETISAVGEGIWSGATGVLSSIGGMFSGITSWFTETAGEVGSWLGGMWDSTTSWLTDAAGGVMQFFSDAASGVGDFFSNLWNEPGETIGGVIDSAGTILGNIGESVASGLSSVGTAISNSRLNPFNWFEEGTRQIEQGGLAVLHSGEMIIPKDIWDKISAMGNGAFGSGSEETGIFGSIFESLSGSSIGGMLSTAMDGIGSFLGFLSPMNTGAFESDAASEALGSGITGSLDSIAGTALTKKDEEQKKQVLAEVSRALNYEQSASEASNNTTASSVSEEARAQISSNILDYTEQLREGEVNTLGLTQDGAATSIEQQRASVADANALALTGLDELTEINEEHSLQYEKMIELLTTLVQQNMGGGGIVSNIVGALGIGTPPQRGQGVRSIARDFTRGFWDLQFGDFSPGNVTTEGRGGSA